MELINPWMLPVTCGTIVLAVVLGVVVRRLGPRRTPRRTLPVAHSDRTIDTGRFAQLRRRYIAGLGTLLVSGVILTAGAGLVLARPSSTEVTTEFVGSRDIMLCADVSGSMTPVSQAVVHHFRDLITELPGDRIGLTVFNGNAQTMFPLTDDHEFARERLTEIEGLLDGELPDYEILAGTISEHGSSLVGDGLASCIARFDRLDEERPRAIVLATDNEVYGEQVFTLSEAADLASVRDITVYGIGPQPWLPQDLTNFIRAVESTGGEHFDVTDNSLVEGVARQITAQEAALLELPPQIRVIDEPQLPWVLATLGLALVIGLTWRLQP